MHNKPLTLRELEVVKEVLTGKRNIDIASALKITEKTVTFHTTNIYRKLGIGRKPELFVWAKNNLKEQNGI